MQCQFQWNRFEIAGQFQKERSERGVEVEEDEYLTPKNDNVANVDIKDEDRNAEASTRLDRDLELDIDFPNPAINEIGSQLDPEDGTEWTFKDERKDKEENLKLKAEEEKSTTATIKKSIYLTEFGGPFQIQLPSLPTVRSLNSVWTVLNNLNVLIYECELQSILFLPFHFKNSSSFSHWRRLDSGGGWFLLRWIPRNGAFGSGESSKQWEGERRGENPESVNVCHRRVAG